MAAGAGRARALHREFGFASGAARFRDFAMAYSSPCRAWRGMSQTLTRRRADAIVSTRRCAKDGGNNETC
ncbi:hypothetical protein WS68_06435 [Burkholderia sp. TSV86]|nr:hypothetical protein WS68_06435 [Burkholderia sp. TSV86]